MLKAEKAGMIMEYMSCAEATANGAFPKGRATETLQRDYIPAQ